MAIYLKGIIDMLLLGIGEGPLYAAFYRLLGFYVDVLERIAKFELQQIANPNLLLAQYREWRT